MESNNTQFRQDYDLDELRLVSPPGRDFRMLVTPRFVPACGERDYEGFSSDLLLNLCRSAGLFVDVGAHYGHYTLLVAKAFPACRVLSLEPVPENYAVLERNVALNELRNVELHNVAASEGEGLRCLKIKEASDNYGFHDHPLTRTLKEIEVRTVSLDGFLQPPPGLPVIVKVDTDGHEPYVLRGMRGLLERDAEVSLLVEFNPKCLRKAGYQPVQFLEEVFALGFDVYAIDDRERMTYKMAEESLERWADYLPGGDETAYCNLLCLKKERSLSVCFFSHSSQLGGAERSLLGLVSRLIEDHGVLCTVILREDGPLQEKLQQAGAATARVDYHWWWHPEDMPPGQKRELYESSAGNVLRFLEHALGKINPDVIATFTTTIPWGAIAAAFLGKPHVWFVRELYGYGQPLKALLPREEAIRFIEQLSSKIVVNTRFVRDTLFGGEKSGDVVTAYTHIEIPPGSTEGRGERCFERENAIKLILLGAVYELKGQMDAVLAVGELVRRGRDVELLLAGFCDTEYAEEVRSTVEEEGLEGHVRLTGSVENPYPIMEQADMVLSCSRGEAFSRSVLEGMLLKKPVVAARKGGTLELVTEGFNGLLYEPGDHVQLADRIEYLADHPEEARRLGENGLEFVTSTLTVEGYSGRIYELLRKVKDEAGPEKRPVVPARGELALLRGLRDVAAAANPEVTALVTELGSSLAENKGRVIDLHGKLRFREKQAEDRHAALLFREGQIAELEAVLQAREEKIAELGARIAALEDIIRRIEGRMIMRLADRYQRLVERLLPAGTGGRRCYEWVMDRLRAEANGGWKGSRRRRR